MILAQIFEKSHQDPVIDLLDWEKQMERIFKKGANP